MSFAAATCLETILRLRSSQTSLLFDRKGLWRLCDEGSPIADAGTARFPRLAGTAEMDQVKGALAGFLSEVAIACTMYRDELLAACLELLLAGMSCQIGLLPKQVHHASTHLGRPPYHVPSIAQHKQDLMEKLASFDPQKAGCITTHAYENNFEAAK